MVSSDLQIDYIEFAVQCQNLAYGNENEVVSGLVSLIPVLCEPKTVYLMIKPGFVIIELMGHAPDNCGLHPKQG